MSFCARETKRTAEGPTSEIRVVKRLRDQRPAAKVRIEALRLINEIRGPAAGYWETTNRRKQKGQRDCDN